MSKRKKSERNTDVAATSAERQMQIMQAQFTASITRLLPDPEELERYNQVVSNGAERLMVIFETQAHHRMGLEAKVTDADIIRQDRGMNRGFVLGALGLAAAVPIAIWGNAIAGAAFGGADIAAIVGTSVWGQSTRRSERQERSRRLSGG